MNVTQPKPALLRQLGLVSATALVVSNMIGTGIFTSTGYLAGDLGSVSLVLWIWVVGAVCALCGAFCYSELGINMPSSGGGCYSDMNLCGQTPAVNALGSYTAHEFMETISDVGYPRGAWRNIYNGEIGDLCVQGVMCVPLGGRTFQIQAQFSNAAGQCVWH